jgi:hypothetical protein
VAFAPSGAAIAVAHQGSPFVSAYPWNDGTGFGTKYSDPGTLPTGNAFGVDFAPSGAVIAVSHNNSPYVSAYPWNNSTGFGTKYSDPGTVPASNAQGGVAFSPSGADIVVAYLNSPYVSAYPWNDSTGFGTQYANPASLPPGEATGLAWSPNGAYVAVAGTALVTAGYIRVYNWSSGWGSLQAGATSPFNTNDYNKVAWSPNFDP